MRLAPLLTWGTCLMGIATAAPLDARMEGIALNTTMTTKKQNPRLHCGPQNMPDRGAKWRDVVYEFRLDHVLSDKVLNLEAGGWVYTTLDDVRLTVCNNSNKRGYMMVDGNIEGIIWSTFSACPLKTGFYKQLKNEWVVIYDWSNGFNCKSFPTIKG